MAAADREFRRALELSPGYAFAHLWQAVFLTAEGRFEEARAAGERALALDPLSVAVREHQGWLRYSAGEYDEAIDRLGRALELDPGYPHAHRYLGLSYLMKGDLDRAITELSRTRAALPDDPHFTIPRTAGVRLVRDNRVIYEGKIASLRRFKDDVSEVRTGFDCGIGLERFQDVKPGDFIEAFTREEVAPSL